MSHFSKVKIFQVCSLGLGLTSFIVEEPAPDKDSGVLLEESGHARLTTARMSTLHKSQNHYDVES